MWQICIYICLFLFYSPIRASDEAKGEKVVSVDCSTLRLGQYICPDPTINQIDPDTQQYRGCTKGKIVPSEGEADGNKALFIFFILSIFV